jgi:hypothetical protein
MGLGSPAPSTLWGRILPAGERARAAIKIFASPAAQTFFEALHVKYEVILDLAPLAGAVLNKVNMIAMSCYDTYGDDGQHRHLRSVN